MTTSTKIKTLGHCAHCGRQWAVLANGGVSKHGYTVDHGFFNGVCSGATADPIEHAAGAAEALKFAAECADVAERAALLADRYASGAAHPASAWSSNRPNRQQVPFNAAPADCQETAVYAAVGAARAKAAAYAERATFLRAQVAKYEGQPLVEETVETKRALQVGDRIKVGSNVVTVEKIADARVFGCGPSLNGQVLPHAYWKHSPEHGLTKLIGRPVRLCRRVSN